MKDSRVKVRINETGVETVVSQAYYDKYKNEGLTHLGLETPTKVEVAEPKLTVAPKVEPKVEPKVKKTRAPRKKAVAKVV